MSMKSESGMARSLQHLDKTADGLLKSTEYTELIKKIAEKHNLLLACKLIEDFLVDRIKDFGLGKVQKKLVEHGMRSATQLGTLANFLIDYGFDSVRFYLAWNNVHDILSQAENENQLRSNLDQKIVQTTDEMNHLRTEVRQLENARGTGDARRVVTELREKQLSDAYLESVVFWERAVQ